MQQVFGQISIILLVYLSTMNCCCSKDHEPQQRSEFSGGYTQERSQLSSQSSGHSSGGWLSGYIPLWTNMNTQLFIDFSYLAEHLTYQKNPGVEYFNQQSMTLDEGSSPLPYGQRPQGSSLSLGWLQRTTVGLQVKRIWTQGAVDVHLGVLYEWSDQSDRWPKLWGCTYGKISNIWISLSYQSDVCLGQKQARLRVLLGTLIGRGSLGIGWGLADQNQWGSIWSAGGPMTWASIPLSAPLYLEMSVWYTDGAPLSRVYADQNKEGKLFMVSLRWSGETEMKEFAPAPSQQSPGSPSSPHPGTIPTPSQQNPLFEPSRPLMPSQPTPSPSTPL